MNIVYVLLVERESSTLCYLDGIWRDKRQACQRMISLARDNDLFSEDSNIDSELGIAESDPTYNSDEYCNYIISEVSIQ